MGRKIAVASYYFPNYHVDARNEKRHGKGWSEWELVKKAVPRFDGHYQPKEPLWGYTDEADPVVMAKKIDAAADHEIDAFIFDWYYYNDGPFLQRCLEEGYLGAKNNKRVKFSIMWANHDWTDIHPAPYKKEPELLYPGAVTEKTFEEMTDHIIEVYFKHPSYWKIAGRPYFSIYELFRFVKSMGGMDEARRVLDNFRAKARSAGLDGVHVNAVNWGVQILPGETKVSNPAEMVKMLGLDSTTSYVWVHHVAVNEFPATDYMEQMRGYLKYAETAADELGVPYFPNATMGWDSTPRTEPQSPYENLGYPYMGMYKNNTPANFEKALAELKRFIEGQKQEEKVLTINCWNEWTEGSYLEPDKAHGLAYLEKVKRIFGVS